MPNPYEYAKKARMMGKKSISYSQVNKFHKCPLRWKLEKIDKQKVREPSIMLVFGTAFHETLQEYLRVMYEETAVAADRLDLRSMLIGHMKDAYNAMGDKEFVSQHISRSDMNDFFTDGMIILEWFRKRRGQYFSKKYTELVGIEMPIFQEVEYNSNIMFNGFLDLVLKEGNEIKIIDIKTSYQGWKKPKQKQEGAQLRLYKKYFSEQYDVDIKDISIEYFIVKRKVWEGGDFPAKRIQIYKPASGKPSINKVDNMLKEFVEHAFLPDGKHNKEAAYPAYKDDCKYCPFKKRGDLCPPHKRILKPVI
jgi:hypothetical protein